MNETLIFFKIQAVLKIIETDAIFTKKEMNNEGNVDFLQNKRCVDKVSRLKLYLPRKKWTMNETLIFIKIRDVLIEYRAWSCIYQERNGQWKKRWFSSKYELCWKNIEIEAVFTKREMNNEWNVDFLLNTSCVENYRDWSCIYPERNEQWVKRWFSSKYELCWKSIKTEAIFTKREINNKWNIDLQSAGHIELSNIFLTVFSICSHGKRIPNLNSS